ncbi:MAG: TRAP transporter large permease [Clostridia bacterium]|nr:TRAP transporter large permease [Clostridia bacterium]
MLACLLISFFGSMFFSVPIAMAISFSSILSLKLFSHITPQFIATQVFAATNNFTLVALPFFMMAGALMQYGGVSKRLISFCKLFVGRMHGSLGMVTVLACMLFAAISGSGPATVVSIGCIVLPLMEEEGYDMAYSGSLIATAGGLGIVIPPSLPMITYAVLADVSVGALFAAGILPGIVLGIGLMIVNYFVCKKKGMGVIETEKLTWKRFVAGFKESFLALLMPVIILGGIYSGLFTPTEAGCVAVLYGLVVGIFVYKEIDRKMLKKILVDASVMAATALLLMSMVDGFNWVLTITHVPQILSDFIVAHFSTKYGFVLALSVLLLVLGCLMSANAAVIILTPICAPIAVRMGFDPLQLGIIEIVLLNIGCVTPPYGVHMFIAGGITHTPVNKMFKWIWILVGSSLAITVLLIFVPEISLFLPKLFGVYKTAAVAL